MNAAKWKQFELWQLEVRVGAKRECLSKLVARLKHDRIDDDAENERDEEVLRECFFFTVLREPWSISVEETDRPWSANVCAIVSFKTA